MPPAKPNAKQSIEDGLNKMVESLKNGISYINNDIIAFNNQLKRFTLPELEKKKDKVKIYYDVASMLEVPINKNEYAIKHIPLERQINPIAYHYNKEPYYCINDSEYQDILASIKHTVTTYERTPYSYRNMSEEDLRNTLLAQLNGTYRGQVGGETFRHKGKTDICIEKENRSAFVAECKMWTGKSGISKAIAQLDSYLTWRDCKTALIYFVRRKEFLSIIETAKETLKSIDGVRTFKERDKNEFECNYISQTNIGQVIQLRVLLFNLYCDQDVHSQE